MRQQTVFLKPGLACLFLILTILPSNAQESVVIKVQYVSADQVYLDKGRDANLEIGDLLHVMDGSTRAVALEVISVAGKSAACKVLSKTRDPKPGDAVVISRKKESPDAVEETVSEAPAQEDDSGQAYVEEKDTRRSRKSPITGSLSLQYYSFLDESGYGKDFQQPGIRLNLKGRGLLGGDYGFRIKTRTRYNRRERAVNSLVAETEWKNRIYEASFFYDNPNARFNYKLGRIISDKFSGVGYIDGGQLQLNLAKHSQVGVFAGSQPEWQSSDLNTSLTKFGAYYNFEKGNYQSSFFQSTVALAGEYHGSTVNREFAYIRNRFSYGNKITLYQSAELDINTDWRKDKAGEDIGLTNLLAYGRFQVTEKVRLGFSYDNRKNYYTYELRNRDELYFDDAARRGYRADVTIKFTRDWRFNGNYGFRERDGEDEDSTFYYANIYKRNFIGQGWSFNLRVNGFTNSFTGGVNPSVRIGKRIGAAGSHLYVGYSNYDYTFLTTDTDRTAEWFRVEAYVVLSRKFFLSSQYEYNLGDDAEGHRIFLELGYRFAR